MSEILASLDDIRTHVDDDKLTPDDSNTSLIQIDVARIIKGSLSSTFAPATLALWINPTATPEYIRGIAGRLIAAQLYAKAYSVETTEYSEYAQHKYDEAMLMLNNVVSGAVTLIDVEEIVDTGNRLTVLDFFPRGDGEGDAKFAMDHRF